MDTTCNCSQLDDDLIEQGYTCYNCYEFRKDKPTSTCCNAEYLWLTCDECDESVNDGEGHDFATCSECGQDVDD
jgi:hypothetical protein